MPAGGILAAWVVVMVENAFIADGGHFGEAPFVISRKRWILDDWAIDFDDPQIVKPNRSFDVALLAAVTAGDELDFLRIGREGDFHVKRLPFVGDWNLVA